MDQGGGEEEAWQVKNAFTWDAFSSLACARICLVELRRIWNMFVASRNALRLLRFKFTETWESGMCARKCPFYHLFCDSFGLFS